MVDHFLFLETASIEALPPKKLASKLAPKAFGFLYIISKTDDNLSPYLAWNPPAEKSMF